MHASFRNNQAALITASYAVDAFTLLEATGLFWSLQADPQGTILHSCEAKPATPLTTAFHLREIQGAHQLPCPDYLCTISVSSRGQILFLRFASHINYPMTTAPNSLSLLENPPCADNMCQTAVSSLHSSLVAVWLQATFALSCGAS